MVEGASGVFNILSNIYDEAFLWKLLTAKSCILFSQKNSLVDVSQVPKYATKYCFNNYIY